MSMYAELLARVRALPPVTPWEKRAAREEKVAAHAHGVHGG